MKPTHPHAAGILLTRKVPTAPLDAHIGDIEKILLRDAKTLDTIHYVYVLDEKGRWGHWTKVAFENISCTR